MEELFRSRPFRIRNADEYDVTSILGLFVSPQQGLATPFDYENTIVKGRMGSGKTMYLRANFAYYLSALVPSLTDPKAELVLPVFIRLNDFQHIREPQEIYRGIIIKVIEELTSLYLHLENMDELVAIQSGIRNLPDQVMSSHKLANSMKQLAQLGSDEYIERMSTELGLKGGLKPKFMELSAEWKKTNYQELKNKPNPGIKDIEECYINLLEGREGQILLLIDEAGSLDKSFFRGAENTSFFEILMNQFRTAPFVRTKIAVYPNSFSDVLAETRYGDSIILEDDLKSPQGYASFRERTLEMISNYLNPKVYEDSSVKASEVFDIDDPANSNDPVEQIIYASNGNMRRMMQLLDLAMQVSFLAESKASKITKKHAVETLKKHAQKIESEYNQTEKEFLKGLVTVCRARGALTFQFPNMPLYKYTNKSEEFNLINVDELGTGRRPTTYSFDYSYAVAMDIPTHRMEDSEKVNRDRSVANGRWQNRVATMNEQIMEHAALPGKIEGEVSYLKKEVGFITTDEGDQCFFRCCDVIEADQNKKVMVGKRVRFYPTKVGDSSHAALLELL